LKGIVNARLAHIEQHAIDEKHDRPGNHAFQRKIAFDALRDMFEMSGDMLTKIDAFEQK